MNISSGNIIPDPSSIHGTAQRGAIDTAPRGHAMKRWLVKGSQNLRGKDEASGDWNDCFKEQM
jgi:hypothetical protein